MRRPAGNVVLRTIARPLAVRRRPSRARSTPAGGVNAVSPAAAALAAELSPRAGAGHCRRDRAGRSAPLPRRADRCRAAAADAGRPVSDRRRRLRGRAGMGDEPDDGLGRRRRRGLWPDRPGRCAFSGIGDRERNVAVPRCRRPGPSALRVPHSAGGAADPASVSPLQRRSRRRDVRSQHRCSVQRRTGDHLRSPSDRRWLAARRSGACRGSGACCRWRWACPS